jgi:hypothetical protein
MSSEPIRVLLVEDNLGDARLLYEDLEEALPGQFQMAHVRQLRRCSKITPQFTRVAGPTRFRVVPYPSIAV